MNAQPWMTPPDRVPAPPTARTWKLAALVVALIATAKYLYILFRYDAYGIAKYFMADDAFYYFQVARKVAAGLGSTFDGVHVTNGYHPLWLLISTLAFKLAPGATAPLAVLDALQVAAILGTTLVLYLALRELDDVAAAMTAALFLASARTCGILFVGMESAPAILLTTLLLGIALRGGSRGLVPRNGGEAWRLFALLLAVSLARLEAGLLAAGWLAVAAVVDAREGGGSRARLVLVTAGLAAAAATYVATNLQLVGSPFPVSGLVKAGHPTLAYGLKVLRLHLDTLPGLVFPAPISSRAASAARAGLDAILLAGLAGLMLRLARRDPSRALALVPFLVFAAGYVLVASFVTAGSFPWYMWPALLLGTLATFEWVRFGIARWRWAPAGALLLALLSAGAGWYTVARPRTLSDWGPMPGAAMDAVVRYIREEIPPGDRVGAMSSGMFTYFSGRDLENLEGLVNGRDFLVARRDPRTYGAYLRRNRIRWIVFRTTQPGERDRVLDRFRAGCEIESLTDLDTFYGLNLRATSGDIPDPHIWVVRLKL